MAYFFGPDTTTPIASVNQRNLDIMLPDSFEFDVVFMSSSGTFGFDRGKYKFF